MKKHLLVNPFLFCVFTILSLQQLSAQKPAITAYTPATGAVGTLITINGTNLNNLASLKIGGVNALPISNTGTKMVAMVMPGAVTGAVIVLNDSGYSASANSNFVVTHPLPPNLQQGGKLVGSNSTGALQGSAVAVSADGNTAIIGGTGDNNNIGAAWIFTRDNNGVWQQQGNKLVGSGVAGTDIEQGQAVAISADGNTAVVGGYADNNQTGAIWVFVRSINGQWTQQGNKLTEASAVNAEQGYAVAISADGNTILAGGYGYNNGMGAMWVYSRDTTGIWSQKGGKLTGTGAANGDNGAWQGYSVALSADGNTAISSGYLDNNQGAAWVFTRNTAGVWSQQGSKLVGTGAIGNALQGSFVAVAADGSTFITGGPNDNNNMGAAWVFTRDALGNWQQQGTKLIGSGLSGTIQHQGYSVGVSADGNIAIAGAPGADAVCTFARTGNTWAQKGSPLTGLGVMGNRAEQGLSVAVSADGSTLLQGGILDANGTGAAWVFTYIPPPVIASMVPTSGPIGTLVTITGTGLSNATSVKIGGVNAIVVSNTATKLVAMVMPGAVTGGITVGTATSTGNFSITASRPPNKQQGNKLVGTGTVKDLTFAEIGHSVALSANGNTAIVDGSGIGAAWIFTRNNSGEWQQSYKLIPIGSSAIGAGQGEGVAINSDGTTAVIGGPGDSATKGAIWVFVRDSSGNWIQQGNKLVGTGASFDSQQGNAVAISADGNTIVSGGPGDANSHGAVWIFIRDKNNVWTQQGSKLIGLDAIDGNFGAGQGTAVAISADGNTFVEGAHVDNNYAGATWVFTRNASGQWAQQGNKLVGAGAAGNAQQGYSVGINANGSTLITGGIGDSAGLGAVWMFTKDTTTNIWAQQGSKLTGTGATKSQLNILQGSSVGISADGNTAIEGGFADDSATGAVWIFTRSNTIWAQPGKKLTGSGATYYRGMGYSTALSADGSTAIAGSPGDSSNIGAARIFVDSSATTLPVTLTNFTAYPQGKGVQTAWSGFDEINMAGYDVERSANGHQFNKIGNMPANDNNATENNYTWFDANPFAGDNYYRIKALSKDGTAQYTRIAKVTLGNALSNIQVYPNPAINKNIQVKLNNLDAGIYNIAVYNEAGQKIYSGSYVHLGGYATVPVQINGISAGVYHVEVKGISKALNTKIVVQ